MNSKINQYIEKHSISAAKVLLFRDWEQFLNVLFSNNGHVEMIVWYEYCEINKQQIGMGGYKDTENSEFMWAETHLFEDNLREKTLDEILVYISNMRKKHNLYDLYPEFYI